MQDQATQVAEERVFDSDRKLRHLSFFEFVASRAEDDPQWRAGTAGLVVLRLVDAWIDEGRAALADDNWAIPNVRAAIDAMDRGTPIRSLLGRVVDAVEDPGAEFGRALTPLMAYAQALEFEAHWSLAADVYETALAHADPTAEADSCISAHLGLARCYMHSGQLTAASEAFDSSSAVAAAAGDLVGTLRARIGHAKVSMARGNFPEAERILDETIQTAQGEALRDVRSRALHDRSNVAFNRNNYELAIQLAYQALEQSQSPRERDRILGDIAVSFLELGVYSAARDAYMVLSATAQEQYVRWAATLNLLEIAAQTGAQTLVEVYRRQLTSQSLPPQMSTWLQLNSGLAYQRFGQLERARGFLQQAVTLAEEYGYNKYLFDAEEALRRLETPPPPARSPTHIALETEEVAAAIQNMRELVSAS